MRSAKIATTPLLCSVATLATWCCAPSVQLRAATFVAQVAAGRRGADTRSGPFGRHVTRVTMHLRSALHDTSWLVCCCCADKENDDDCCCADKENVDGGGYARYIAHGDLQDLAHAGDDASALHNTSWLVCCCCADKESDDGGGYARDIAHRDLQDLCTWCSECVERRGSADRCRNACGCSR